MPEAYEAACLGADSEERSRGSVAVQDEYYCGETGLRLGAFDDDAEGDCECAVVVVGLGYVEGSI